MNIGVGRKSRRPWANPRSMRSCLAVCSRPCCSVLQCVAVCCSVLQCVAVCCRSTQQWVAVCWKRVAVCCCVAVCCKVLHCVLMCVAVCCSVLQCVAGLRTSELQCVESVMQCVAGPCVGGIFSLGVCCRSPRYCVAGVLQVCCRCVAGVLQVCCIVFQVLLFSSIFSVMCVWHDFFICLL